MTRWTHTRALATFPPTHTNSPNNTQRYNGAVVFHLDEDGHPTTVLFETKMSSAQVNKVVQLADGLAVEFDVRDVQYARRCVDVIGFIWC